MVLIYVAEFHVIYQVASPEDIIREINDVVKGDDLTVILEPGRSLVAGSAILLTTVLGVKKNGTKQLR